MGNWDRGHAVRQVTCYRGERHAQGKKKVCTVGSQLRREKGWEEDSNRVGVPVGGDDRARRTGSAWSRVIETLHSSRRVCLEKKGKKGSSSGTVHHPRAGHKKSKGLKNR